MDRSVARQDFAGVSELAASHMPISGPQLNISSIYRPFHSGHHSKFINLSSHYTKQLRWRSIHFKYHLLCRVQVTYRTIKLRRYYRLHRPSRVASMPTVRLRLHNRLTHGARRRQAMLLGSVARTKCRKGNGVVGGMMVRCMASD